MEGWWNTQRVSPGRNQVRARPFLNTLAAHGMLGTSISGHVGRATISGQMAHAAKSTWPMCPEMTARLMCPDMIAPRKDCTTPMSGNGCAIYVPGAGWMAGWMAGGVTREQIGLAGLAGLAEMASSRGRGHIWSPARSTPRKRRWIPRGCGTGYQENGGTRPLGLTKYRDISEKTITNNSPYRIAVLELFWSCCGVVWELFWRCFGVVL